MMNCRRKFQDITITDPHAFTLSPDQPMKVDPQSELPNSSASNICSHLIEIMTACEFVRNNYIFHVPSDPLLVAQRDGHMEYSKSANLPKSCYGILREKIKARIQKQSPSRDRNGDGSIAVTDTCHGSPLMTNPFSCHLMATMEADANGTDESSNGELGELDSMAEQRVLCCLYCTSLVLEVDSHFRSVGEQGRAHPQ